MWMSPNPGLSPPEEREHGPDGPQAGRVEAQQEASRLQAEASGGALITGLQPQEWGRISC